MKSLLKNWNKWESLIKKRFVFLCLDYDGTLTPIVQEPREAVFSKHMRGVLSDLSRIESLKIIIASGRRLGDLKKRVGVKNVVYIGNHGFEIDKIKINLGQLKFFKQQLGNIRNILESNLAFLNGVIIEDKKYTLSVHYRKVLENRQRFVRGVVYKLLHNFIANGVIEIRPGKKVLEIRPVLAWNKGLAVNYYLNKAMKDRVKNNSLFICVGDDNTDEDMFSFFKKSGLTVSVGYKKGSSAKYFLRDTWQVYEMLVAIRNLKEE